MYTHLEICKPLLFLHETVSFTFKHPCHSPYWDMLILTYVKIGYSVSFHLLKIASIFNQNLVNVFASNIRLYVCIFRFLPVTEKKENESTVEFAERVRFNLAKSLNLQLTQFTKSDKTDYLKKQRLLPSSQNGSNLFRLVNHLLS